jgi:hypothetical protein
MTDEASASESSSDNKSNSNNDKESNNIYLVIKSAGGDYYPRKTSRRMLSR